MRTRRGSISGGPVVGTARVSARFGYGHRHHLCQDASLDAAKYLLRRTALSTLWIIVCAVAIRL